MVVQVCQFRYKYSVRDSDCFASVERFAAPPTSASIATFIMSHEAVLSYQEDPPSIHDSESRGGSI